MYKTCDKKLRMMSQEAGACNVFVTSHHLPRTHHEITSITAGRYRSAVMPMTW